MKKRSSPLEDMPRLVCDIIMAAEDDPPHVSHEAIVAVFEDEGEEVPPDLSAEFVGKLRVWKFFDLEYETALFEDSATAWLLSDASSNLAWLVHIVEGAPGLYPVGPSVPANDADWGEDVRERLARRAAELLADESFGAPTDVIVAPAFEWLAVGLETSAHRMPSRPTVSRA